MINFKDYISVYKRYKAYVLGIVILVLVLLPLALFLSHVAEIASKLKAYHYIGTGLQSSNTISISGEGKIYTKPDMALVDFSVVSEGARVVDVQKKNTEKTNQAIKFLKDSGVEEKDIKTINYNLYPQYSYIERQAPQIIGYSITQTLEVKIRALDKVGEILEGVAENGVNQIGSLYFKVDKDEEFKEAARKLAIDDAKAKANKLASQLGVKLTKIIGFSESSSGYPLPLYESKGYGMGGGGTPDIQTGESEIIVDVVLIYELN